MRERVCVWVLASLGILSFSPKSEGKKHCYRLSLWLMTARTLSPSVVSLEMSNSEQLKAQMLRLLRRRGMRRRRRRDKPSHLTTPKGIVHTATWLLFFLP